MFEDATEAVEAALAAGARYADARVVVRRTETMRARNSVIESLRQVESAGLGVRALMDASWGFFATSDTTRGSARKAGLQAAAIAATSAAVPGDPVELAPAPISEGHWKSQWTEHPLDDVTMAEKGDLLVAVTSAMNAAGVPLGFADYMVWDTQKWFVSSEGHRISQHSVECGAGMWATAVSEGETQRRSYPGIGGQYGTEGWELVRRLDLVQHAPRIAEEALALLTAPVCEPATTDLILGSEQLALQIHESVGHAVELDRILGWEASSAGTSWLDLRELGSLRFGSDLMNVTADSTLPGALGSFGYDDEGTPAQSVDIVKEGKWVGVLSGRDSAAVAGLPSAGMIRADGYNRLPMVRMTNIGLVPGDSSLEDMIAATDDGILMDTNRSWSIDDKRLNFQFGCEIAWEVRGGERKKMLRNPTYTGISPAFWASMDMVGNRSEWVAWGTPMCGKGQPGQYGHTSHPAVPARFRNVRVGTRG